MEFTDKVVVITGGAMGIGRSCAESFHEEGATVVIGDVDVPAGRAFAAAMGDRLVFRETDVCSLNEMEALADHAISRFGRIDVLVNNAALALPGVVDEVDEETFTKVINTNLNGVWRGMKVCVPHMRKQGGGAVVNMSSVQSLRGFTGWPAYAAAKGAINALTQQTAVDLAPAGIRVNAVAPGTIMTPMNESIFASLPDGGAALREKWNSNHPIGRFGWPSEVADAVLFLASSRAAFITGEVLRIDGGLAIKGE